MSESPAGSMISCTPGPERPLGPYSSEPAIGGGENAARNSCSRNGFGLTRGSCSLARAIIHDVVISGPAGGGTVELPARIVGDLLGTQSRGEVSLLVRMISRMPSGTARDLATGSVAIGADGTDW